MKTTLGNFVDPLLLKDYPDLLKSVKSVFSSQAMLKNIIENYNGTITFNSELGNGTEFIVSFPITK